MERARRGFAGPARRAGWPALRRALSLPRLALRAAAGPRERPLSDLSDRQLADIGLSRADIDRLHARSTSPELDLYRVLRWRDWR